MKKISLAFILITITVVLSMLSFASTSYSVVPDPTTITTYRPNYYSNAGYIDISKNLKLMGIVFALKMENFM